MKIFQSHTALLIVLIVGLVWSEQVQQENEDTNDLETAESAFFDPKFAVFAGLAGIGALVVKGVGLGVGVGKLLLLAKHAGQPSHNSGWDSSSSVSYSSHPAYPKYKSYSSSYSYSSSEEAKPTAYTGTLKVSGSLSPVSSHSSDSSSSASSSSSTAPPKAKTSSLSLDDTDDPLPAEN